MAESIISRLAPTFTKALESGDVLFFPSSIHKIKEGALEFEIRLCPALLDKPVPHIDNPTQKSDKKPDPFAPPYNPGLLVGEIESEDGGYAVVLNKYAVVPSHFILTTKEFASQKSPPTPTDLAQAYLHLLAGKRAGQRFLSFINCGDHSGASQAHKHLQFIPVDADGPPIEQIARRQMLDGSDKAFAIPSIPYSHFILRIPDSTQSLENESLEDYLGQIFIQLLDLAIATIRRDPDYPSGAPSYNVLLTLEHMYIIPRRQERHKLEESGEELSINSLGFAGMLLVKSQAELDAVVKEGVLAILSGVGVEKQDVEGVANISQD